MRPTSRHAAVIGASVLFHVLALSLLALVAFDAKPRRELAKLVGEYLEEMKPEELPKELDEPLDLDTPVSLDANAGGGAAQVSPAALSAPSNMAAFTKQTTALLSNRSLSRPLSTGPKGLSLNSNVKGLKGVASAAAGEGGLGSIEEITREILRQLHKSKVCVVWVLDGSISLRERREEIASRLDRVYKELLDVNVIEDEAVLTAVVSYGGDIKFPLRKPTADIDAIKKAIRNVPDDESGLENVCSALRAVALEYRRYQTGGNRALMPIVVTDEIGTDKEVVDATVQLLKRNNVPVYVVGPMAVFNMPTVEMWWEDDETGERFAYYIDRGPAARMEEIMRVTWQNRTYKAGFGAFNLASMTYETGGRYFVYDDYSFSRDVKYDYDILIRYAPSNAPRTDYVRSISESPYRRALMEFIQKGNPLWQRYVDGRFRVENWQSGLQNQQRRFGPFDAFADVAIPTMLQVDSEYREEEASPRWRANFDLSLARLLQCRARTLSWNWAYAQFLLDPQEHPRDDEGKEADPERWVPAFGPVTLKDQWVGLPTPSDEKASEEEAKKKDKKSTNTELNKQASELVERARFYFQRVIDEHPGTVWAVAAEAERDDWLGFKIRPTYIRTLTAEEQAQRSEARARMPKGF